MPLGQGNKGWLFLGEEPLHIPVVDYLWTLSDKSRLLSLGGGGKEMQYVVFVCWMIKQYGFHSLEIHGAHLKCERQKEAETTCVALYAANTQ